MKTLLLKATVLLLGGCAIQPTSISPNNRIAGEKACVDHGGFIKVALQPPRAFIAICADDYRQVVAIQEG